jgi:hypothetical protein
MRFRSRHLHALLVCEAIALASAPGFAASIARNPYQEIVERNVFALKPPPAPMSAEDAANANRPPLPPIKLTGITTILGGKRAFLNVQMPAKPPEPAKPMSYMLSEGQRDGEIEVLEIDEKGGSVKLNAFGVITNVPFEVIKSSAAPATGGHFGAPTGIPAPPANAFQRGSPFGGRTIPTRTLRMGPNGGQTAGGGFGAAGSVNNGGSAANGAMPQRSAEETVALYEANRLKNEQLIQQGVHLPRMPMHPYLSGGQGQAPAAQ